MAQKITDSAPISGSGEERSQSRFNFIGGDEEEETQGVYGQVQSFNILGGAAGTKCSARCDLLDSSRGFMGLRVTTICDDYSCTIFLNKKRTPKEFPYTVQFMNKDCSQTCHFDMFDVETEDVQQDLKIRFNLSGRHFIVVQFLHEHDYEIFKRFVTLKNIARNKHIGDSSSSDPFHFDFGKQRVTLMHSAPGLKEVGSDTKKGPVNSVQYRKKKNARSLSGNLSATESFTTTGYWNTKCESWSGTDLKKWFNNVLFQPTEDQVISLAQRMTEEGVDKPFFEYIDSINIWPFMQLRRDIKTYEDERKLSDPRLEGFFKKSNLYKSVKHYMSLIEDHFEGYYNMSFYTVLHKRVFRILKRNGKVNLSYQVDELIYEQRHLWHIPSLRDHLVFALLFNQSFSDWQTMVMFQFNKYTGEQQKEDPDLSFMDILEKFHKLSGFKFEYLHFQFFLQVQHIQRRQRVGDLRDRIQVVESEKEEQIKKLLEEKIKQRELGISKIRNLKDNTDDEKKKVYYTTVLTKLVKARDQLRAGQDKQAQLMGETYEKQVRKLVIQRKELQREMMQKHPEELTKRENWAIRRPMKLQFMVSKERKNELEKLVKMRMEYLKDKQGSDVDLKVKLVLARRIKKPIQIAQRFCAKVLDKLFEPSFFKFGFVHAYVLVKNIGIHWFDSEMVYAEDMKKMWKIMSKYEEVVCIDTDCAMICDLHTLLEELTDVAKTIISWNTNMRYSPLSLRSSAEKKNCQEFCVEMLKSLKAPMPFYPIIEEYIKTIKDISESQAPRMRRLVIPSEEFENKFVKVIEKFTRKQTDRKLKNPEKMEEVEGEEEDEDSKKKKKKKTKKKKKKSGKQKKVVVFETHAELDEFVYDLVMTEPGLETAWPGVYYLLKAFDRSYWAKQFTAEFPPMSCQPIERGCPFNHKK